jgi:hypothetical protein
MPFVAERRRSRRISERDPQRAERATEHCLGLVSDYGSELVQQGEQSAIERSPLYRPETCQ